MNDLEELSKGGLVIQTINGGAWWRRIEAFYLDDDAIGSGSR